MGIIEIGLYFCKIFWSGSWSCWFLLSVPNLRSRNFPVSITVLVRRFWMTKLDAGLMTSLPASDPGSTAVWGSKRINPRPQSCLCLAWSGCPSNDDDDDSLGLGKIFKSRSDGDGGLTEPFLGMWTRINSAESQWSGNLQG